MAAQLTFLSWRQRVARAIHCSCVSVEDATRHLSGWHMKVLGERGEAGGHVSSHAFIPGSYPVKLYIVHEDTKQALCYTRFELVS